MYEKGNVSIREEKKYRECSIRVVTSKLDTDVVWQITYESQTVVKISCSWTKPLSSYTVSESPKLRTC